MLHFCGNSLAQNISQPYFCSTLLRYNINITSFLQDIIRHSIWTRYEVSWALKYISMIKVRNTSSYKSILSRLNVKYFLGCSKIYQMMTTLLLIYIFFLRVVWVCNGFLVSGKLTFSNIFTLGSRQNIIIKPFMWMCEYCVI